MHRHYRELGGPKVKSYHAAEDMYAQMYNSLVHSSNVTLTVV